MRCTIVPPHMLERLARQAENPALRDMARRTLVLSATQRVARRSLTISPAAPNEDFAPDRTIHDAENQEQLPGKVVRKEGGKATGDKAADECYDWAGVTFDFYEAAFRRNSIDGAGMPLVSTVHYGQDYGNAFWDGKQMVYGDGDGEVFNGFTGPLDVSGHELTHGVIQHTANLEYFGQPGALNESIADVMGSLIKQWHQNQTADQADWLIGEGLLAEGVNGKALRSLKEPGSAYDDPQLGKDPQPGHMDDYVDTYRDNGGVHINSGIPNHAFYLLAVDLGGHAWEKAGKIWYAALTGDAVREDTDFKGFAAATVKAAEDLFGGDAEETGAVKEAWNGVGVQV